MGALKNLTYIDSEITGPATGTISGAQAVSFRMTAGTATILTNQDLDFAGTKGINFEAVENGEPLPDIAYSVAAASTMIIVGYKYEDA